MSSQKGNASRNRPQKHQNRFAFKNNLHDSNIRTKRMNAVQIHSVCPRCKDILEWKIKYKKYKMLKAPKNCNKCHEKRVKEPYHTACNECAGALGICPKCAVPRIEWAKDGETTTTPSVNGGGGGNSDQEDDDSDGDNAENDRDDKLKNGGVNNLEKGVDNLEKSVVNLDIGHDSSDGDSHSDSSPS